MRGTTGEPDLQVPISFFVQGGGGGAEAPASSGCFPCSPFRYCPLPVRGLLPETCQRIQDCTHATLVFGVLAGVVLVITSVMTMTSGDASCSSQTEWCMVRRFVVPPLTLLFALPVVWYCMGIIKQYDAKLQSKQKLVAEEKEKLLESYQYLLSDMDSLLLKSTESTSGLAERSFESKRRDFQRFLEKVKLRFKTVCKDGETSGDAQVLNQFRRFCWNWLQVFRECSIDPVNMPKMVVTNEELTRCSTVTEVADLCLDRLRVTEVRFITLQRDQDQKAVNVGRTRLRRHTAHMGNNNRLALTQGGLADELEETFETNEARRDRSQCSWLQCGSGYGCQVRSAQGQDFFPKEIRFFCGKLIIMSRQHLHLMLQSIIGFLLLGFEVFILVDEAGDSKKIDATYFSIAALILLSLTEMCVVVLLQKFEELDTIQKLEREVKELKQQNDQVEKQREKMCEFWNQAQELNDLWLYRTVPRLELYKEIHVLLEDGQEEDMLTSIAGANNLLEDLEAKLNPLGDWRGNGSLSLEKKKVLGLALNGLFCEDQPVDELLTKLEEITRGSALKSLKG